MFRIKLKALNLDNTQFASFMINNVEFNKKKVVCKLYVKHIAA